VFDVDELHQAVHVRKWLHDDVGVTEEVGPMSDLIGWVLALGLVAALWGAATGSRPTPATDGTGIRATTFLTSAGPSSFGLTSVA
jgi:hypothetical protein